MRRPRRPFKSSHYYKPEAKLEEGEKRDLPGVSEHLYGVGRQGPHDELADVRGAETHEGHGQGLGERIGTTTPGKGAVYSVQ